MLVFCASKKIFINLLPMSLLFPPVTPWIFSLSLPQVLRSTEYAGDKWADCQYYQLLSCWHTNIGLKGCQILHPHSLPPSLSSLLVNRYFYVEYHILYVLCRYNVFLEYLRIFITFSLFIQYFLIYRDWDNLIDKEYSQHI